MNSGNVFCWHAASCQSVHVCFVSSSLGHGTEVERVVMSSMLLVVEGEACKVWHTFYRLVYLHMVVNML